MSDLDLLRELRAAHEEFAMVLAGRGVDVRLDVPPGLTDDQREALRRLVVAEDRWRDR